MKLRKYVSVYRDLFLKYFPAGKITDLIRTSYAKVNGKVNDFEVCFLWALARNINPRDNFQTYDKLIAEFPDYNDKTLTTLYRVAFESAYGKKVMDFVKIERL